MADEKEIKKNFFENGLKRLEEIVATLESGEAPLDESIKLFEEGIKKTKELRKYLEHAKRKIEIIIKEGEVLKTENFEEKI
ncbi:MAG: exodeoxyribonuclease VII small subunit [Elusimicrobia bacterium]|nr:exodeoxyribonuclease VII small subunit [Elusimicrobiota bacterium]